MQHVQQGTAPHEFQGHSPCGPYSIGHYKFYTHDKPEGLDPTDKSLNIQKIGEKDSDFWKQQGYEAMGLVVQPISKGAYDQGSLLIKNGSSGPTRRDSEKKFQNTQAKHDSFVSKKKSESLRLELDAAFISYRAFMYKDALEWVEEAEFDGKSLTINQQNAGSFEMLYNIKGDILGFMGRYEEAEMYLNKSYEITQAYFKNHQNHFAMTNANRAELYYLMGRFEESELLWREVLEIIKADGSIGNIAYVNYHRTQLNLLRNDVEKAKKYSKKAFEAAEQLKDDPYNFHMGRIRRNQGWISVLEERKTEGREFYKEALGLLKKTLPKGNVLFERYKTEYQKYFNEEFDD